MPPQEQGGGRLRFAQSAKNPPHSKLVYSDFKDVKEFIGELKGLLRERGRK